jgi:hypothetical protein
MAPPAAPSQSPAPKSGGIQPWATKLIIAICVIGGSLLLALAIFMIYRWRRSHTSRLSGYDRAPSPRIQHLTPAYSPSADLPSLERKFTPWENTNSSANSLLKQPMPIYTRADTSSSSLRSYQLAPVGTQALPSKSPFPPPNPIAEQTPFQSRPRALSPQSISGSSHSSNLIIQGPRVPSYPKVSKDDAVELSSRITHFSSARMDIPETIQPEPTEIPESPEMNGMSRFSVATTASSIAQYRSVESWVGLQAGRLSETVFQTYLETEIEKSMKSGNSSERGESPEGNKSENYKRKSSIVVVVQEKIAAQVNKEAGKRSRAPSARQSRRSRGKLSDYMQHPGTEVQFPRASLVPSEIFDSGLKRGL